VTTAKDTALALKDVLATIMKKLAEKYGCNEFSAIGSERELFRLLARTQRLVDDVLSSIGMALINLD